MKVFQIYIFCCEKLIFGSIIPDFIPEGLEWKRIALLNGFLTLFYPPKGAAKGEPKVVQLFLLMFYPPKGDTQYLTRGSIDTLSIYCVSKSLEPFKNLTGFSIFFFLEMFYCGWAGWDG